MQNAELAQKQCTISLLEQKNAQFVEELVEQQKTITKLKRQLEDKERHRASYLHKVSFNYSHTFRQYLKGLGPEGYIVRAQGGLSVHLISVDIALGPRKAGPQFQLCGSQSTDGHADGTDKY